MYRRCLCHSAVATVACCCCCHFAVAAAVLLLPQLLMRVIPLLCLLLCAGQGFQTYRGKMHHLAEVLLEVVVRESPDGPQACLRKTTPLKGYLVGPGDAANCRTLQKLWMAT